MPINRRQFELGVDKEGEGWMREIYDHLASHRDLAYSYQELLHHVRLERNPKGIEGLNREADEAKLERVLNELVWIGAIGKNKIDGSDYYAFLEEFDTQSWEPKVRA